MIYVVLGMSASGKDTIVKQVSKDLNIPTIISHTTRPMRDNEKDGVAYHFVDNEFFLQHKEEFVEIREYNIKNKDGSDDTWYYGVHRDAIPDGDCIVILDAQGLKAFRSYFGRSKVLPFFVNVSDDIRLERLSKRGDTDNMEEVKRRMKDDKIKFKEFIDSNEYYEIYNEGLLEEAVIRVENIINRSKSYYGEWQKMILAIDTSMSSSGYAVISKQGELITYGKVATTKKNFKSEDERINHICDIFQDMVEEHKVTDVIMENQFIGANVSTGMTLKKLCGALCRTFEEVQYVSYVTPASWRKALLKSNKSVKKEDVYKYVRENIIDIGELKASGVKKNDDIYEGIAIGYAYLKDRDKMIKNSLYK